MGTYRCVKAYHNWVFLKTCNTYRYLFCGRNSWREEIKKMSNVIKMEVGMLCCAFVWWHKWQLPIKNERFEIDWFSEFFIFATFLKNSISLCRCRYKFGLMSPNNCDYEYGLKDPPSGCFWQKLGLVNSLAMDVQT